MAQSGVNEWPVPATRTPCPARRAATTSADTSASLVGAAIRAGVQVTLPDQFCHPWAMIASLIRCYPTETAKERVRL